MLDASKPFELFIENKSIVYEEVFSIDDWKVIKLREERSLRNLRVEWKDTGAVFEFDKDDADENNKLKVIEDNLNWNWRHPGYRGPKFWPLIHDVDEKIFSIKWFSDNGDQKVFDDDINIHYKAGYLPLDSLPSLIEVSGKGKLSMFDDNQNVIKSLNIIKIPNLVIDAPFTSLDYKEINIKGSGDNWNLKEENKIETKDKYYYKIQNSINHFNKIYKLKINDYIYDLSLSVLIHDIVNVKSDLDYYIKDGLKSYDSQKLLDDNGDDGSFIIIKMPPNKLIENPSRVNFFLKMLI